MDLEIVKLKKMEKIKLLLISVMIFFAMFRIYIFSNDVFKSASIVLCSILLLLFGRNKYVLKESIPLIIYAFFLGLTTVYNHQSVAGIMNAVLYFLQFSTLFLVTGNIVRCYGIRICAKYYYLTAVIVMIITDISIFFNIDFDPTRYQNLTTYLIGNKFMVVYLHMHTFYLLALYKGDKKRKLIFCLYGIYSMFVAKVVDCSTGIVGIFIIMILLLLSDRYKIKSVLCKTKSVFLIMFTLNILLLSGDILIHSKTFQYIVTNILHEDMTLTGRTKIYGILSSIISKKPLWGFGYNSNIITTVLGYGNAQNGLLQIIIDSGFFGLTIFLINLYKYVSYDNKEEKWPLYCALYAFIICSLVEISFKLYFFMIIALFMSFRLNRTSEKYNITKEIE